MVNVDDGAEVDIGGLTSKVHIRSELREALRDRQKSRPFTAVSPSAEGDILKRSDFASIHPPTP